VIGHSNDEAKDYLLLRLRRNKEQIGEALVFRKAVEPFAAELAAKDRTSEDLARIVAANQRALAAETDVEFMSNDTEFHLAIARAAHNRHVYKAVEEMRLILNDAITALPESDIWKRRTATEHAAIIGGIKARRSNDAAKAMEHHTIATEKSISALLAAL
jgi:DNA-binding FadR family transcriptional regulator